MLTVDTLERHIERIPESGCWIWMKHTQRGYGRANGTTAHRAVYKMLIGDFPEHYEVDHKCRVRECVNPYHLEPVTKQENMLRSNCFSSVNARKATCRKGHEYTVRNNGYRKCLICDREYHKIHDKEKRKNK